MNQKPEQNQQAQAPLAEQEDTLEVNEEDLETASGGKDALKVRGGGGVSRTSVMPRSGTIRPSVMPW
jgi:hypothetical protein